MNLIQMLKTNKNVFFVFLLLILILITSYYILKTNKNNVIGSCKSNQTQATCKGENICVDNCKTRCGPVCSKKCYNEKTQQCIDDKVCEDDNVCYDKQGHASDCCTIDKPNCGVDGKCMDCKSKGGVECPTQSSGSDRETGKRNVTCCIGEDGTCCKGSADKVGTCCKDINCKKNPALAGSEKCCEYDIADDGECCHPAQKITDKNGKTTCCENKICWDKSTNKKSCCSSADGCQDTSMCLLQKDHNKMSSKIEGTCLLSDGGKNSTAVKVCVNKVSFLESSLEKCSKDSDCTNETCDTIYYRNLPKSAKCSDDSQCTGMGSQGTSQVCYKTNKNGNPITPLVTTPCDPENKDIVYGGKCSTHCGGENEKSIWCPPGDTCATFTGNGGVEGAYCANSKCIPGTRTYNPTRLEVGGKKRGTCKQQYQVASGIKCKYIDVDTQLQYTKNSIKDNKTFWCDFSDIGDDGQTKGNTVPYSGSMTFPEQVTNSYSGFGDSNFHSFSGKKATVLRNDLSFNGKRVPQFPAGDVKSTNIRTYADVDVTLEGVCSASDCYNSLNEKGLAYLNYDGYTKQCSGKFTCDGSSDGYLTTPSITPGDFLGFNKEQVCSDTNDSSTEWGGLVCPEDYDCGSKSLEGSNVPNGSMTYYCYSNNN
jgi:hypothetical protein